MGDAKHQQRIRAFNPGMGKAKKPSMAKQHAQKEDKIYALHGLPQSNSK